MTVNEQNKWNSVNSVQKTHYLKPFLSTFAIVRRLHHFSLILIGLSGVSLPSYSQEACPSGKTCLFVASSGNDSASGTETTPLQSLTRALNKASPGDIVLLKRGDTWTIAESGFKSHKTNITIDAYGSGSIPVLDGRFYYYPKSNGWSPYTPAIEIGSNGNDQSGAGATIRNIEIRESGGESIRAYSANTTPDNVNCNGAFGQGIGLNREPFCTAKAGRVANAESVEIYKNNMFVDTGSDPKVKGLVSGFGNSKFGITLDNNNWSYKPELASDFLAGTQTRSIVGEDITLTRSSGYFNPKSDTYRDSSRETPDWVATDSPALSGIGPDIDYTPADAVPPSPTNLHFSQLSFYQNGI